MNTKIKLFGMSLVAFIGFFAVANFASAQGVAAATCNSATVSGTLSDTGGASTNVWFEGSPSSNTVSSGLGVKTPTQTFSTPQTFTQTLLGLTGGTTYYYRAVFSSVYGTSYGSILSFTTPLCASATILPSVTTSSAASVSQTSATLNGFVTPNGTNTSVWFEWGTTQSFGNNTSYINYGTGATSITGSLSSLVANTTYYFRAVAQNSQGIVQGNTMSFTTSGNGGAVASLPTITTQSATSVAPDSAVLGGYVDPKGSSDTVRWFEWGTNLNQGSQYQTVKYNQGSTAGNFSGSLSGLTQNVTYYFRAAAQNSQGVVYGSTLSFTTGSNGNNNNNCGSVAWGWGSNCVNNVVVVSTRNADTSGDFAVLNGYVDPSNTNDTVRWFEWGGSQSLGNSTQKLSQGNVASNFSASLTGLVSNTTYYYRAAARNSQGTVYGNMLSFTTGGQTNNAVGSLPAGTTLLATELTGTAAKLNGLVFTSASQPSNAWFEWGTSSTLGNKTQTVSVGMLPSVKHSDVVSGLVQGQTYYYRIVAENPYGKVYGSINNFVSEGGFVSPDTTVVVNHTSRPVAAKPSVVVVSRGSSTQSLVALTIDGGTEAIAGGDKRSYHITWKNESTQSLKNVVLRVIFPQTMNFESTTLGVFSAADNAVIVDIKTLVSGGKGDAFITATADRGLKAGELVVVTANMVYTSAGGIQGDAIAYVTHRAEATASALSASIFTTGSFLPTTLLGWILLIILVLVLVLLGNHLYGRFSDTPPAH